MDPSTQRHQEVNLLHAAQAGDERSFRSLYDIHVDPLFRYLQRFSTDRAEAQDWVQRAFIRAFGKLDRFDGRSSFATWLFRIGINEMNMDHRKMKIVELKSVPHSEAGHAEPPADEFLWEHTMHDWLNVLDTTKRSVFILHEVEGFAHGEIAGLLDISESHSRTILTRVRQYLKDQWEKERQAQ